MDMTLDQLPPGKRARVTALLPDSTMRDRLQDLGLTPGGEVTALMKSPLGDPVAYLICGAVIALRRRDAVYITVTPKP